jgi:hypothetical protein
MVRKLETKSSLEQIIEKGGSVAADKMTNDKEWKNLLLRLRIDMLENIDNEIEKRPGMSKNSWIREAIQEKLKRENENPT